MKSKLERLKKVLAFIRGELVVLEVKNAKELVVDAGNKSKEELLAIASSFFRTAYNLSR